jgi:hypothetical protein
LRAHRQQAAGSRQQAAGYHLTKNRVNTLQVLALLRNGLIARYRELRVNYLTAYIQFNLLINSQFSLENYPYELRTQDLKHVNKLFGE